MVANGGGWDVRRRSGKKKKEKRTQEKKNKPKARALITFFFLPKFEKFVSAAEINFLKKRVYQARLNTFPRAGGRGGGGFFF
jgi:hypothetical protein